MKRYPPRLTSMIGLAGAAFVLAACTNTPNVLQPSALLGEEPANTQPSFPLDAATNPTPTVPTQSGAQTASIAPARSLIRTDERIQFAPVVGASPEASTPLSSRLSASAQNRGLSLVGPADSSATLVMKGYFSAISDDGETTVIYVWDVIDPAGSRVHRIQGQAKAPANGAEGWAGVQPATMEAIADQTLDQLASWLQTRQG